MRQIEAAEVYMGPAPISQLVNSSQSSCTKHYRQLVQVSVGLLSTCGQCRLLAA